MSQAAVGQGFSKHIAWDIINIKFSYGCTGLLLSLCATKLCLSAITVPGESCLAQLIFDIAVMEIEKFDYTMC